MVGGWLRFTSYYQLGRQFTFYLMIRKDHTLITDGMYAYIRHPGYIGSTLIHLGVGLIVGRREASYMCWLPEEAWKWQSAWVWAVNGVLCSVMAVKRVQGEEKMMEKAFGEEWREYKKRTWYVVPWVL